MQAVGNSQRTSLSSSSRKKEGEREGGRERETETQRERNMHALFLSDQQGGPRRQKIDVL